MPAIKERPFLSPPLPSAATWPDSEGAYALPVHTRFSSSPISVSMSVQNSNLATRKEWQRVIDEILEEWGRNPAEIEDAGIDAPSDEVIALAIAVAQRLRTLDVPAPTRVVPDPNGGIIFRRQENDMSEEYHFWEDGSIEFLLFDGAKLIERRQM